jgi:hypothetical protein
VVRLTGEIENTPDDPTYGSVWKGFITATITVPKQFSFQVNYLAGKKYATQYWFTQIKPKGGSTDFNDKTVQKLEDPLNLGPVQIVAIAGRLYHHMKDDGSKIVPDANIKYGAYLSTVVFDKSTKGKTARLGLTAELLVATDGEYEANFNGDLQLVNTSVDILKIDETALAKGTLKLYFNSRENHFVGKGTCEIKKPGALCMGGCIIFDFKPGAWRIAVGTKEEKIYIVPTCVGWGGTGWLDVNQNTAEIGLGLMYAIYVSKNLSLKIVSVGITVDGALAAGIQVKAQYNPSFQLLEAGLWASLKLKVYGDYEINLLVKKSGKFTLLDILANADLLIVFNPPPKRAKGSISGYVDVLGIFSTDFDASFDKEF